MTNTGTRAPELYHFCEFPFCCTVDAAVKEGYMKQEVEYEYA